MTPQEKQLLERFLADMAAARAGQKDPEAEALIREAVSRQPDAAYLLVQRALQLDQVLQIREAEVQKLQNELAQSKSGAGAAGGGFLGDPYAWGAQPRSAPPPAAQSSGSAPIPGVQRPGGVGAQLQAAPQQQQPQAQARPWGGSGMLGTVATTAAGVVAGSFLYQGIQNLMHRNDPPAASGDTNPAGPQAQPLLGDSSGFDDVVPEEGDLYAAGGGDDGDVA